MEKYITSPKHVLDTIKQHGVAIIPSLLDKDEIDNMNDGMWNYLEHITADFAVPINRDDEKTWRSFYNLYPIHSMLIQHWDIGHAQHVWDLRQNPKVVDVFAKIWNCNGTELLTSFDGSSFHFPPEETNRGFFKKSSLHCDQSFTRNKFECVQSWITGYDVDTDDATLLFLDNSHKYHLEFKEYFDADSKDDWYQLNEEEYNFYKDKGCIEKRISCPAGSMVLWDSRTIHCGSEPLPTRKEPNIRNVSYICMMPRSISTPANINKKINALVNLRTTTHWVCKTKLFPKVPRTYGGPMPNVKSINPPVLTELGRKLAGY
jgi:ectoine hydroxylase-related dioxygenase (phytanoyl-CoA dioxygenase family)